jgi:hypothetical protein
MGSKFKDMQELMEKIKPPLTFYNTEAETHLVNPNELNIPCDCIIDLMALKDEYPNFNTVYIRIFNLNSST